MRYLMYYKYLPPLTYLGILPNERRMRCTLSDIINLSWRRQNKNPVFYDNDLNLHRITIKNDTIDSS